MTNSVNILTSGQKQSLISLFDAAFAEFDDAKKAKKSKSSKDVLSNWYGSSASSSVCNSEVNHIYVD